MTNAARVFGMKLALDNKHLALSALIGTGTGLWANHQAKKNPETADTAALRGVTSGIFAGGTALTGLSALKGLKMYQRMGYFRGTGALPPKERLKAVLMRDALVGATGGAAVGQGLATAGKAIPGALSPQWKPVNPEHEKHDMDEYNKSKHIVHYQPQYQDPDFEKRLFAASPGGYSPVAGFAGGAAAGAVLYPLLKHSPTAFKALQKVMGDKARGVPGDTIHVDFGDQIRKRLMPGT